MGGDGDLGLLGFLWCQRESYHLGNGEYRVYIYIHIYLEGMGTTQVKNAISHVTHIYI